jgi:hypothetical protein
MAESRVVRPETKRLEISRGDWLLVKRRLNTGERRRYFAAIYQHENAAGRMTVDPLQTGVALVVAYLLDWSLVDEAGQIIPIRDTDDETKLAAIDAIDYDSFIEIKRAVEAHEEAQDRAATAKKTIPDGAPPSEATSPSLVGAAGAMSGSGS